MTHEDNSLVDDWMSLWNGDYASAERLVAPDFSIHAALMDNSDSDEIKGPQGLVGWIQSIRAFLSDLHFTPDVGPIVQGDLLALRWDAAGHYGGSMPGAHAPVGTPVHFAGTDILRVSDGRLVEYWLNSDVHVMLAQLQVASG